MSARLDVVGPSSDWIPCLGCICKKCSAVRYQADLELVQPRFKTLDEADLWCAVVRDHIAAYGKTSMWDPAWLTFHPRDYLLRTPRLATSRRTG